MVQNSIVPEGTGDTVEAVTPRPVPARKHIGIVPFVPSLTVRPTVLQRLRGWLS